MSVIQESNVVLPISAPHVFSTPKVPTKIRDKSSTKKKLNNPQSKITVFCRPRPIIENSCLAVSNETKLILNNGNTYTYDYVFPKNAHQNDVYDRCAKEMVEAFMREQRSCLLFCYGVSGSGKTFTIEGDPQNPGIVPKLMKDLSSTQLSPNTTLNLSYFEIYQESVYDLMEKLEFDPYTQAPLKRKKLKLIEGKDGFIEFVSKDKGESRRDLKKIELKNLADAVQIWKHCKENRSVSGTALNDDSSRSHSVFMVRMFETVSSSLEREVARLSIVDLAGSERIMKSKPTQEQQTEAGSINNSLIMLSEYLKSIRNAQSVGKPLPFISCRGSKLTRLFQDTFTRNRSIIRVIVNINPIQDLLNETENALKFGSIANSVDTAPLSVIKSTSKRLDPYVSPRLLAPIGNSTTPRFNSLRKKKLQNSEDFRRDSQLDQENLSQSLLKSTPTHSRIPLKIVNKNDITNLLLKESDIRKTVVHILETEIKKQDKNHEKGIEIMRLQFEKREQRQVEIYMRIIKKLKGQISSLLLEKNEAIQSKKESIEKLQKEIDILKSGVNTQISSHEDKAIKLDNTENLEQNQLKAELAAKEESLVSLQKSIANLEEKMNAAIVEKENILIEAKNTKSQLELSYREHIAAQNTKFDIDKKLLESNTARLKEEIATLKKQAEEDKKRRAKESKLNKSSKTRNSFSNTELRTKIEMEFESKIKNLEEKLAIQKKQTEELTLKQHIEMSNLANKHGQEIYSEKQKYTALMNEMHSQKQNHDTTQAEQISTINVLKDENNQLKEQIVSLIEKLKANQTANTPTIDMSIASMDYVVISENNKEAPMEDIQLKTQIEPKQEEIQESNKRKKIPKVKKVSQTQAPSTKPTRTTRGRKKAVKEENEQKQEVDDIQDLQDIEEKTDRDTSFVVPQLEDPEEDYEMKLDEEFTTTRKRKRNTATQKKNTISKSKSLIGKVVNSIISPIQTRNSAKRKLRRFSTVASDDDATIEIKRRRISTEDEVKEEKIDTTKKQSKTKTNSNTKSKVNESLDVFDFLNESDSEEETKVTPSPAPTARKITRRIQKSQKTTRGKK